MFLCDCGGVLLVKSVEEYPARVNSTEKLEYERKCTVECVDCRSVKENQRYD